MKLERKYFCEAGSNVKTTMDLKLPFAMHLNSAEILLKGRTLTPSPQHLNLEEDCILGVLIYCILLATSMLKE